MMKKEKKTMKIEGKWEILTFKRTLVSKSGNWIVLILLAA